MKRVIFYISDGTGITAETLGGSLLTQFPGLQVEFVTIPYVNNRQKALAAVASIDQAFAKHNIKPVIIATITDDAISTIISSSKGFFLELFSIFLQPLADILQQPFSHIQGRSHGMVHQNYHQRMEAINLALACDDGMGQKYYNQVDLILVGPSRSGKTPTCLYLALQFGIKAANYPMVTEDLERIATPSFFEQYPEKLFGLTLDPLRLKLIRNERVQDSKYSSKEQCTWEINKIKKIFQRNNIIHIDATNHSVEEIATIALEKMQLSRKIF